VNSVVSRPIEVLVRARFCRTMWLLLQQVDARPGGRYDMRPSRIISLLLQQIITKRSISADEMYPSIRVECTVDHSGLDSL